MQGEPGGSQGQEGWGGQAGRRAGRSSLHQVGWRAVVKVCMTQNAAVRLCATFKLVWQDSPSGRRWKSKRQACKWLAWHVQ